MNRSRKTLLLAVAALLPQLAAHAFAEPALTADFAKTQEGLASGFKALAKSANPKVRQAGKASTWDQARKACTDIESGDWDLPTDYEYFGLVVRGIVDVGIKLAGEKSNYYPMWIRTDSEDRNQVVLSGTGLIVGMADGKGEDMFPMDISPAGLAAMKEDIAEIQKELDAKNHRTEEEEKKVAEAMAAHRKANPGTWLNPEVPHPGVFSDEINKILEKNTKESLLKARAKAQSLLDAVKDGHPVYCVAQ